VSVLDRVRREDMLRLHGQERIAIGLSISDAISTSLLEALVMGSFPIQSRTSCAYEWIECGRTGFLVDPEDPQRIADSIRRAIADDALVDRAAELNLETAAAKLDDAKIQPQVVAMYEGIAEKGSAKTPAPNRRL
jgi:glycosyltransferase involved in cell wall biosynthesis